MSGVRGRTAPGAGRRPTILSWRRLLICLGGGILAAGLAAVSGVPESRSGFEALNDALALLSYLFGTVVIAVAVNLVTNLGQSS